MPLKAVRVCEQCEIIRWAPCCLGCQVEKQPWVDNLQDGAGTFEAEL